MLTSHVNRPALLRHDYQAFERNLVLHEVQHTGRFPRPCPSTAVCGCVREKLGLAQTGRRTRRPVMSGRCKESFDVVRAEGGHRQPVADEIVVKAQRHRAVLDHRLI